MTKKKDSREERRASGLVDLEPALKHGAIWATDAEEPAVGAPGSPEDEIDTAVLETVAKYPTEDRVTAAAERESIAINRRYVDIGEIARGGMSTVRRARDRGLMREIALKRLDTEFIQDDDRVLRFVEEAQITGQLDHPNIVPIHELGKDEFGAYYFSMKLVEGKTLEEVIADAGAGRLAPEQLTDLLEILVRVCEAVAFAHSRGVIHRDLKPANIMVGEFGQVYLMDWGIARILQQEGANEDDHSVTVSRKVDTQELDTPGLIIGTPSYMAPEQVEGQHDLTDERTDVFALGATLYHLLTGGPPYQGPNYYNLLVKAIDCKPKPPQDMVPDGVVPPGLARIAMKAMAKDADERYQSVVEMQRELEQFLRGAWNLPTESFAAGAAIVTEGEEGDAAYIITEGECVVLKEVDGEQLELRRMGPGDVFGEVAIFSSKVRTATVQAVDDVTVMVVDSGALTARFELNSWIGRFVSALADRFREVDERLRNMEQESGAYAPYTSSDKRRNPTG